LFRWAFAWPIRRSTDEAGTMFQNAAAAREAGVELSVYEVNHHTTHGDGPLEPRNRLVASIGGGLNVANTMLMMLKEHGARTQCLFSLVQHSYRARGVGSVRLWGTALNMRRGHERFRPTFLACMVANHVTGGDLVETVHAGADPTFDATGVFDRGSGATTLRGLPCLRSYAFADGARRGLVLINLSTSHGLPASLEFSGGTADSKARSWLLTADSITANNEFEQPEPQVRVVEEEMTDFGSGARVVVPPFSMRALSWQAGGRR
jgi:hypothetical protein